MLKQKQLKQTSAELTLKQKYDQTRSLMGGVNPKTKKVTNVHIRSKSKALQSSMDVEDNRQNRFKTLLANNDDSNQNRLNLQVNHHTTNQTDSNFLQNQFGVSGLQKNNSKALQNHGRNDNSYGNSVNRLNIQELSRDDAQSITHQIFVKDADQRQVLNIETQSRQDDRDSQGPWRNQGRAAASQVMSIGFRDYLEQEQLDRADVNDLLSMHSGAQHRIVNKFQHNTNPITRQPTGTISPQEQSRETSKSPVSAYQSIKPVNVNNINQSINIAKLNSHLTNKRNSTAQGHIYRRQSVVESQNASQGGRRDSILSNLNKNNEMKTATMGKLKEKEHEELSSSVDQVNRLLKGKSFETLTDKISVFQGGRPLDDLHPDNDQFDKTFITDAQINAQKKASQKLSQFKFSKPYKGNQNQPMIQHQNVDNDSITNGYSGTSWHNSVATLGNQKLLTLPMGERPDSRSSMGRFIQDFIKHDGHYDNSLVDTAKQGGHIPADHRGVDMPKKNQRNNQLSKSIDVAAFGRRKGQKQSSDHVINQDSILIKHEFDANQSRLLETHNMTQKAHLRMQQLIAMLRHKTATVGLLMSDNTLTEFDNNDNKRDLRRIITLETPVNEDTEYEDFSTVHGDLEKMHKQKFALDTENTPMRGISLDEATLSLTEQQGRTKNIKRQQTHEFKNIEKQITINMTKFKTNRDLYKNNGKNLAGTGNAAAGGPDDSVIQEEAFGADDTFRDGASAFKNGDYRGKKYPKTNPKNPTARELFGKQDSSTLDHLMSADDDFFKQLTDEDIQLRSRGNNRYMNQSLDARNIKSIKEQQLQDSQMRKTVAATNLRLSAGIGLNGQVQKKIINSGLLTSVPKRGKMIDTQTYIRKNLQPYADNKHFGFTKKPKEMRTIDINVRKANILTGNIALNMTLGTFINPHPQPLTTSATPNNQKRKQTKSKLRGSTLVKSKGLDYEPIIPLVPKKRVSKQFRITRNQARYDSQQAHGVKDMLAIQEEENDAVTIVAGGLNELNDVDQLVDENYDLRQQLKDMVGIFEQYLKVASLKEVADRAEDKRNGFGVGDAMDIDQVQGGDVPEIGGSANRNNVDFDQADVLNQTSQPFLNPDSKLQFYETEAGKMQSSFQKNPEFVNQMKRKFDSFEKLNVLQTDTKSKRVSSSKKRHSSTGKKQEKLDQIMVANMQIKEGFFMNHHMPFIKSPRETSQGFGKYELRSPRRPTSQAKNQALIFPELSPRGAPIVDQNQLRVLATNEHKTHNMWLQKIQALWDKLNSECDFDQVIRLEEEIKQNKQGIKILKHENMRENAKCLSLQIKFINKAKSKIKSSSLSKPEKKLLHIQKRITEESEISKELNMWGLHSHVIAMVVQVRLLEDLIDHAQKCQVRPDAEVDRELYLMSRLQKQTELDINYWLKNRNHEKWRTWDNPRRVDYKKPTLTDKLPNSALRDYQNQKYRDEQALQTVKRFVQMMDTDLTVSVVIAREMATFLNMCFQSQAWLTLSRVKALRELNKDRKVTIEKQIEDIKENARVKTENLNWLQLTPGNKDMLVVGRQPLWQKYSYIFKEKRPEPLSVSHHEQSSPAMSPFQLSAKLENMPSSVGSNDNQDPTISRNNVDILIPQVTQATDQTENSKTAGGDVLSRKSDPDDDMDMIKEGGPPGDYNNIGNDKQMLGANNNQSNNQNSLKTHDQAANSALKEVAIVIEGAVDRINETAATEPKKSKWAEVIARQQREAAERKRQQEEARAKRLARLFAPIDGSDDSDDEEPINVNLDRGAATTGIESLMDKVNVHLQVEMNILRKWKQKDNNDASAQHTTNKKLTGSKNLPTIYSTEQLSSMSPVKKDVIKLDNTKKAEFAHLRVNTTGNSAVAAGKTKNQQSVLPKQIKEKSGVRRQKSTLRKQNDDLYKVTADHQVFVTKK